MQSILIVYGDTLLSAAVESLLLREKKLSVVTTTIREDDHLSHVVEEIKPNVIIIDEDVVLTGQVKLCELLESYPGLRIFVVGVEENLVQVYEKREILVSRATDLVGALQIN